MSSRRRRRRRRHHRRIGKKMSSFRRRRRLPPPQEHVRIRRGCNKSHLFLFSVFCLSLSSRAENTKKAVFIYTHRVSLCVVLWEILSLFFYACVLPKILFFWSFLGTLLLRLSHITMLMMMERRVFTRERKHNLKKKSKKKEESHHHHTKISAQLFLFLSSSRSSSS